MKKLSITMSDKEYFDLISNKINGKDLFDCGYNDLYNFSKKTVQAVASCIPENPPKREKDTDHTGECALEIERKNLNNGGPFAYEEWCTCTHCGFRQALFIPRNYCPKCGYKFTSTIRKGFEEDEDE